MNIISRIKSFFTKEKCKCKTERIYTEKDLVKFGEYLLSDDRRALYRGLKNHPLPFKDRIKIVNQADIENFKKL